MQDKDRQKTKGKTNFQDLSIEERRTLVDVFAWLIKQDKKQNPAYYQLKKTK
jgi:hypothetical protein